MAKLKEKNASIEIGIQTEAIKRFRLDSTDTERKFNIID